MSDAVRLTDEDWGLMFTAESVRLGRSYVDVQPLTVSGLAAVARRLRALLPRFVELGVTLEGLTDSAHLPAIAEIVLADAPEIIALCTGLDADQIGRLPAARGIELAAAVVRVNQQAQEGLEKNWRELVGTVGALIPSAALPTPPKS